MRYPLIVLIATIPGWFGSPNIMAGDSIIDDGCRNLYVLAAATAIAMPKHL